MSDRAIRWAGASGIAFVVLIVITISISGSLPMADDPVSKIRNYYIDHRSTLLWANLLAILAIPFVLWFGVMLREMFRSDRLATALGTFSLAGLIMTAAIVMVGSSINVSVVYIDGAAQHYQPKLLRLMYDSQSLVFAAASAGIVAFTLGAALAIHRSRALPSFTMWLALLAVVGNIVTVCTVLDAGAAIIGIVGVAAFSLFILVTGITMAAGKASDMATASG